MLGIQVCNIVIHLAWIVSYNALTRTFFKSLWEKRIGKTLLETNDDEKVGRH